ncbi:ferric reductase like transmembrane component-domain-containing protein [Microdochium trichocladiopsis]|uniref:Ferric reductase like transmembrane component-domain-containing protein n=1 Tax=Microdochium trichocladiopsis TaxID=1682393 RepID=A0A9P9BHX3_9PEZI|nr:ferric reductase like transmembrane component-domain-containing protein [Microdochium trichocladiopsis]KAH7020980.1 ferric reductase like transmembrane component-domain-containing protein [Microdochium trichocladiopsis]
MPSSHRHQRSGTRAAQPKSANRLAAASVLLLASSPHLVNTAAAATVYRDAPCFEACQTTLRSIRFTDAATPPAPPGLRPCEGRLAASSLFLCATEYCTVTERTAGLAFVNETCHRKTGAWLPPLSIIADYTDEDVARLHRFEREDLSGGKDLVFDEPVLPSETLLGLMHDTLAAWAAVWKKHLEYSLGLFVFWTAVIAIGLSYRFLGRWDRHKSTKRNGWIPLDDSEDEELGSSFKSSSRTSLPHQWIKRYITIPATFGQKSSQSFGWYTVPPRVQTLTLATFVVMNIAFCCHGYWVFPGNMYWADTRTQWLRYVADRTGIISFANFPLIWLFGMRNNLLMWLTGWDFGTYNNFHRWVARVSTVQAIVHSVAYTIQVFDSSGWDGFVAYFDEFFWWTGEIATILMSLLLGLSLFWFRRNTYELFLIIHIGFSVIILYTMWAHVTIFNGRFDPPIWTCCAIWVADRIMRMARTISFNPRFWSTIAEATYDSDANMVRVSVPASRSLYKPKPGTFYYLHVLNDKRFWESHPFTMAKLSVVAGASATTPAMSDEEDHLLASPKPAARSLGRRHKNSKCKDASTMKFLIRPYDSFTGRLRDSAAALSEMGPLGPVPTRLRVLIEGPYGHTQPFERYDNLLFVVGGSGIVVPLAYITQLLQSSPVQSEQSAQRGHRTRRPSAASIASHLSRHANSRTRAIRIIWAVRESALADSVLRDDFDQDVLADERLSIHVYVTKAQPHSDDILLQQQQQQHDEGGITSSVTDTATTSAPNVKILHGRPLVPAEIDDFAADFSHGSLAVVACGPGKMADDARRTVVDMQGGGGGGGLLNETKNLQKRRTVDYFEESFNW